MIDFTYIVFSILVFVVSFSLGFFSGIKIISFGVKSNPEVFQEIFSKVKKQ